MVQISHTANISLIPKNLSLIQLKLPQAHQRQQNNHNDSRITVPIREGEYINVNSSGAKKSIRRVHIWKLIREHTQVSWTSSSAKWSENIPSSCWNACIRMNDRLFYVCCEPSPTLISLCILNTVNTISPANEKWTRIVCGGVCSDPCQTDMRRERKRTRIVVSRSDDKSDYRNHIFPPQHSLSKAHKKFFRNSPSSDGDESNYSLLWIHMFWHSIIVRML